MTISSAEKTDLLNIELMLLAAVVAMLIPFELFLFSYAILGPLHYLTEISWLHDKNYYTKGRYDALFLLVIGLAITLGYFNSLYGLLPQYNEYSGSDLNIPRELFYYLPWIALLSSLLFVTVKNNYYRLAGFFVIIISLKISTFSPLSIYLSVFLPTLIHVYIFTGLFMLYGTLKSKSRFGLPAVFLLLLCPVLLFTVYPGTRFFSTTQYGIQSYIGGQRGVGFIALHIQTLSRFFGYNTDPVPKTQQDYNYWYNAVFNSRKGLLLARCIAFAYTYHYLNWFSKTRIIRWHEVPRGRFVFIVIFWLISIALYLTSYTLGLQWLFFISYLHVLLELPLNITSIVGIGKSIRQSFQSYFTKVKTI
jgi:hypothetical protein